MSQLGSALLPSLGNRVMRPGTGHPPVAHELESKVDLVAFWSKLKLRWQQLRQHERSIFKKALRNVLPAPVLLAACRDAWAGLPGMPHLWSCLRI